MLLTLLIVFEQAFANAADHVGTVAYVSFCSVTCCMAKSLIVMLMAIVRHGPTFARHGPSDTYMRS